MSDPILELLAAPPNPSMSVDEHSVYAGGRRRLRRRRIMTVAGVAAATVAIAGTIGVLAPRVNNDALPALPTPTVAPTPEVNPTRTSTATPSATVTANATATPTSTPSATSSSTGRPSRNTSPSSTPTRTKTPSPSTTPTTGLKWSDPVMVGGLAYQARLVPADVTDGYQNYNAELRANGSLVMKRHSRDGEASLVVRSDPRVIFAANVGPLSDVISENSQPVGEEEFKSITLPFPERGAAGSDPSMTITIIRLPREATVDENGNVVGMVARTTAGEEISYCVGYCSPS